MGAAAPVTDNQTGRPARLPRGMLTRQIDELVRGIAEIRDLDRARQLQMERIEKAREREAEDGGLLEPWLHKEIEVLTKLAVACIEKKQDLGMYQRVPKTLDLRNMTPNAPADRVRWDLMSHEEREAVRIFGEELESLLLAQPRNKVEQE